MKLPESFDYAFEGLTSFVQESVGIIRITGNAMDGLTDLELSDKFLKLYDIAEKTDEIKAVLIINDDEALGENAYNEFLSSLSGNEVTSQSADTMSEFQRMTIRAREINMLHRFALRSMRCKKPVIVGLVGRVVTPFFGLNLAADFRYAADNVVFSFAHTKYGLHPSGGLAFFLPRYVGQGKASDLLLQGGELSAQEALKLGLVNAVLPMENFKDNCIRQAKAITAINSATIDMTKQLLNSYIDEFEEYLTIESKFIRRSLS